MATQPKPLILMAYTSGGLENPIGGGVLTGRAVLLVLDGQESYDNLTQALLVISQQLG